MSCMGCCQNDTPRVPVHSNQDCCDKFGGAIFVIVGLAMAAICAVLIGLQATGNLPGFNIMGMPPKAFMAIRYIMFSVVGLGGAIAAGFGVYQLAKNCF